MMPALEEREPHESVTTANGRSFAKTRNGHVYELGTRHRCGDPDCPANEEVRSDA